MAFTVVGIDLFKLEHFIVWFDRAGCSKASVLTRPTPVTTSPSRPESAETASLPKDALFHSKAAARYRLIRGGWDDPNARIFPIPYFTFKGSLVDPRLRASNEHILIVRVPRAGGAPGYPTPFSTSC